MCWYIKDSKMLDFLVAVAKSKTLQDEFKADPKGLMQREGLAQKDQDMLLTTDQKTFLSEIAQRH